MIEILKIIVVAILAYKILKFIVGDDYNDKDM